MTGPNVRLVRLRTGPQGTFGLLAVPGLDFPHPAAAVECEWRDNERNVSCIPPGRYQCRMTPSPHFHRRLYLVLHVPDRYGIRLHPANFARELRGCIAVGRHHARFPDGTWGVVNSASTLDAIHRALGGAPFILTIGNLQLLPTWPG